MKHERKNRKNIGWDLSLSMGNWVEGCGLLIPGAMTGQKGEHTLAHHQIPPARNTVAPSRIIVVCPGFAIDVMWVTGCPDLVPVNMSTEKRCHCKKEEKLFWLQIMIFIFIFLKMCKDKSFLIKLASCHRALHGKKRFFFPLSVMLSENLMQWLKQENNPTKVRFGALSFSPVSRELW